MDAKDLIQANLQFNEGLSLFTMWPAKVWWAEQLQRRVCPHPLWQNLSPGSSSRSCTRCCG